MPIDKMRNLASLNRSQELLQRALLRLTELDQQAEREKTYGKVTVEIVYRQGIAEHVRDVMESRHNS